MRSAVSLSRGRRAALPSGLFRVRGAFRGRRIRRRVCIDRDMHSRNVNGLVCIAISILWLRYWEIRWRCRLYRARRIGCIEPTPEVGSFLGWRRIGMSAGGQGVWGALLDGYRKLGGWAVMWFNHLCEVGESVRFSRSTERACRSVERASHSTC